MYLEPLGWMFQGVCGFGHEVRRLRGVGSQAHLAVLVGHGQGLDGFRMFLFRDFLQVSFGMLHYKNAA